LDPNTTAQIVAKNEKELQSKLLIEFPVFPLNDELNKVLIAIIVNKVDSLRALCRRHVEKRQHEHIQQLNQRLNSQPSSQAIKMTEADREKLSLIKKTPRLSSRSSQNTGFQVIDTDSSRL
jgi:hypothetical protein